MIVIDVTELRKAFLYNPETGELSRITPSGLKPQKPSISSNGYARVGYMNKRYGAHRVAWALSHGKWPTQDIDHINGVRHDNRIANLRCVDRSTNLENLRGPKGHNKSSGVLGVYISPKGLITSRIAVRKQDIYLGSFPSVQSAADAYLAAKRQYHKGSFL